MMSRITSMIRYYFKKPSNSISVSSRSIFLSSSCYEDTNKVDNKGSSTGDDANTSTGQKSDDISRDAQVDGKVHAERKLNSLLKQMLNEKNTASVAIPIPREKAKMKAKEEIAEKIKEAEDFEKSKIGNKLAEAATKVANAMGGDPAKTEKELLDLYFKKRQSKTGVSATKNEAKDMKSLLGSMNILNQPDLEDTRSFQIKKFAQKRKVWEMNNAPLSRQRCGVSEKIDIFGAEPLNIFSLDVGKGEEIPEPTNCLMWNYLEERDIRLSVTHPPENIFEQLIQWTEQGKIWKFPINNEQDWKEEENVDFTEHIFLEHLIDPWCPSSGPIRHFMELVCTGLSRNPYLTVAEKHAHIYYFEHYFRAKNAILEEHKLETIKERVQEEEKLEATA